MAADLHTLAGAYALDALPDDELRQFEEHLATCESCAREVRGMTAAAAGLGAAAAQPPPESLRARVLATAQATPQLAPLPSDPPSDPVARPGPTPLAGRVPRRRRWASPTRLLSAAAAACLVAVVAVGVNGLQDDLEQARALNRDIAAVLAAPDVRVVTGEADGAVTGTAAISLDRDQAVVVTAGLEPLPESKTYQLWSMPPEGDPRSVGLLRPDDDGRTRAMLVEDIVDTGTLAVTVEPAGGSPQPTSDASLAILVR